MADAATWKRRTAQWRASGLTAREFAAGRDFAPSTLTWWAWRLGQRVEGRLEAGDRGTVTPSVSFARVVRVADPEPETPIELEIGAATVLVRRGFHRATLLGVLDALEARSGARS